MLPKPGELKKVDMEQRAEEGVEKAKKARGEKKSQKKKKRKKD